MKRNHTFSICMVALAIVINIVGSNIALWLHLPIYLDSIGTFLVACLCGPIYGMLPNLLSGLVLGMTSDVFSLYYAPVGILLGLITGIVWKKKPTMNIFLFALVVTIPTSLVSACITAFLFGGLTSSGMTVLVQILAKTPLGLTLSCFIVQVITDYLDRIVGLWISKQVIKRLPSTFKNKA